MRNNELTAIVIHSSDGPVGSDLSGADTKAPSAWSGPRPSDGKSGRSAPCHKFFAPADAVDGRVTFEVFDHLLTALDGPALLALNGCNHTLKRLTDEDKVWTRRLKGDFTAAKLQPLLRQIPPVQAPVDEWGNPQPQDADDRALAARAADDRKMGLAEVIDNPKLGESAKRAYLSARDRFVAVQRNRRQLVRDIDALNERRAAHREAQQRYKEYAAPMHWCTEPMLTCCVVVAGAVFVVLSTIDLGGDKEHISPISMIPFWFLLFVICCVTSCTCYMHYAQPPRPFNDRVFDDDNGLIKALMKELGSRFDGNNGDHGLKSHRSMCFLLSLLLLFCILLSLQVTHVIAWPWYGVFMPLYVGFAFLMCFHRVFSFADWRGGRERYKFCALFWITMYLPALIFVVLLNVRLDGTSHIPLAVVFVPFWLFNCLSTCFAAFRMFDGYGEERWLGLGWCCSTAMFCTFEILLCVRDMWPDTGITIVQALIPLDIWLICWFCAGTFICVMLCRERWDR